MSEETLVQYIQDHVDKLLPSLEISAVETQIREGSRRIDIRIQTKDRNVYLIETKTSSEPTKINEAISSLKAYASSDECLIVATPKMSEKGKFICKQAEVGYLDLRGNVYLKCKNILIDRIQDQEVPLQFRRKTRRVKQPFSDMSFNVLLFLLFNQETYTTQQELNEKLKISKSYINRILKTFEDGIRFQGETILFRGEKPSITMENLPNVFVVGETISKQSSPSGKKPMKYYRLINPGKILDILAKEYEFKKNKIISFYSFERNPDSLIEQINQIHKETNLPYALTLHAGAAQVAPYVRYNDIHVYIRKQDVQTWKETWNLKETELGGNVNLLIPQYEWYLSTTQLVKGIKVVNNVLLYLDLINYPQRGEEQAAFLREQRLRY